jgi:hypothetical protein
MVIKHGSSENVTESELVEGMEDVLYLSDKGDVSARTNEETENKTILYQSHTIIRQMNSKLFFRLQSMPVVCVIERFTAM